MPHLAGSSVLLATRQNTGTFPDDWEVPDCRERAAAEAAGREPELYLQEAPVVAAADIR